MMNDIYQSKYLQKKNNKQNGAVKKFLKEGILKTGLTAFIFLVLAILCKGSGEMKERIVGEIYEKNLSFGVIKDFYNRYLGGVLPFDKIVKETEPVFKNELVYQDKSKYLDGVKLMVGKEYLVPVLTTGIVVYIGDKEGYGKTVIIQSMEGLDTWYGNMDTTSVKLYDYIEKGDLLGKVRDDYLYVVYSKNNEMLNYEDYLK